MQRLLALLLAALAAGWSTEKGRRFDVHAPTSVRATKVSRWSEETARAFEDLMGLFPGKRAAVVVPFPGGDVLRGGNAADPPAPADDESWRFQVPRAPSGEVQGSLVPRAPDEETRVRHLLGHRLLAEWTARLPDGGPKPDGSGCALPDWFEEAVAADMEPEYRKRDYRRAFAEAARRDEVWGLGILLGLKRPRGVRKDPFEGEGVGGKSGSPPELPPDLPGDIQDRFRKALEELKKGSPGDEVVDHAEGVLFEVESWNLLEFLRREYGVAFVRRVADTFAANRGFGNCYPWLEKHREELRDPKATPPGTDGELEAAWRAWAKGR